MKSVNTGTDAESAMIRLPVAVDRIRDDVAVWVITALHILENIRSNPTACWDAKERAAAEQEEGENLHL